MNIGDKYKLEADSNNLILYKRITPEQEKEELLIALANGEEPDTDGIVPTEEPTVKWKRLGYFSTMAGVLNYITNNEVREEVNLSSLEQIVAGQRELALLITTLDFGSVTLVSLRALEKKKPTTTEKIIEDNAQEKQE